MSEKQRSKASRSSGPGPGPEPKPNPKPKPKPKPKRRVLSDGEARRASVKRASAEARQLAGVILQVLAGELGTGEAAVALGKSPAQYYKLEVRALDGLLQGCEPRPRGRQPNPEHELAKLKTANAKLERECARLQSLVRLLGKTNPKKPKAKAARGKSSAAAPKRKAPKTKTGKPRKRKRTVRALRLAAQMTENVETTSQRGSSPAPPSRPRLPSEEGSEQPKRT